MGIPFHLKEIVIQGFPFSYPWHKKQNCFSLHNSFLNKICAQCMFKEPFVNKNMDHQYLWHSVLSLRRPTFSVM